ncbi:hypothetical protein KGQ31_01810 [Patescibacteria group bacterium]|nr:hypothetical protein [Patescibacteria group bacterium]
MRRFAKRFASVNPRLGKALGIFLLLVGFLALITPFTPGSWLMFIGLELLGVDLLIYEKIKERYNKHMAIEWNKVTWYSKLLAVIVFLATLCLGFYIGVQYGEYRDVLSQAEFYNPPQIRCGGFIRNAPTCPTGYHCILNRIPDTGGVCVKD